MTPAAHIPHGPVSAARTFKLDLYLKQGDSNNIAVNTYSSIELVADLLSGRKPVADADKEHLRILRYTYRVSKLNQEKAFGGPRLRHLVVQLSEYMHGLVTKATDTIA